jgi:hypothetical protein
MMNTTVTTTMDPKEFLAKHNRISCRHGEVKVTADAKTFNEQYNSATGKWTYEIGLYYPRYSTGTVIEMADETLKDKDGKLTGDEPPGYKLTQEDFDAVLRGEIISVPIHN